MYRLIVDNELATLEVNENISVPELKKLHEIINNGIEIKKVSTMTLDQLKLLWCVFRELGDMIGYTMEEMREVLQNQFCYEKGIDYFSLSPSKKGCASLEVATEFITWIIEWAVNNGYNLILHIGHGEHKKLKSAREVCPDVNRYVIACLKNKTCAICGKNGADLHHWDNVASIGGYEHDDGLKTRFMSLCREHHSLFHAIGEKEFEKRYHVNGVWLNVNLVQQLKGIYKGHFKAFDINNYKKEVE